MRHTRIMVLILLISSLLSACGLPQLDLLSPDGAPTVDGTGEPGEKGTPVTGDQPRSPNPEATYSVNLPIVEHSEQQEHNWQLVPQESETVDEDLNLRIRVRRPEIEGASDEGIENFNQEVQQLVQDEVNVEGDLGGLPVQDPGGFLLFGYQVTSAPDWKSFEPYSVSDSNPGAQIAEQVVLDAGHQVLAVVFEIVSYFGGAYPGAHHRVINYDLTAGRVLGLSDLFRPEANYLQVIADYSVQELGKNPEILFQDFEQGAAPQPENYQVWSLTPKGLLVIFEEYQVAPYAAGPQYVVVPYSALQGILDPTGPVGTLGQ